MRWNKPTITEAVDGIPLYLLATSNVQSGSQHSVESIKAWATLQADHYRLAVVKQRRLAQERRDHLQEVRRQHEARLATLREEQQALPEAHWGRALLFLIAALVGLVAEFTLTWVTIPFMLDLKRRSIEAILLSLSPAVATLALDVIIDRLIEKPWRTTQNHTSSTSGEYGIRASRRMTLFLLGLGAMITLMFLTLGLGRMEGAHWQTILATGADDALTTTQPVVVDIALVTLSLGVLLTTALFLLLGMQEARVCVRHISIGRAMNRQARLVDQARQAASEAVAEAERCEAKNVLVDRLTAMVAQLLFRWQMEHLLAGRSAPRVYTAQQIDTALNQLCSPTSTVASSHTLPNLLSTRKEMPR